MNFRYLMLSLSLLAVPVALRSQGPLDPALLGKPAVDAWPTYHGDYSGRRYSTLTQINQSNVKNLALAWVARANTALEGAIIGGEGPAPAAGFAPPAVIKSTPLMVNGVLYFTAPNNAWGVDARTGVAIWHYFWKARAGARSNRGMAMWGNWLYLETGDDYIVSLDAATGKERWHKQIADVRQGYYSSTAPTVIRNHVLVGMGGDFLDVPAWLESRDPETGDVQWKWYTTPRPGQPGSETWPDAYSMERGGGMPWVPPTYDPELNLVYVPTGNPQPVMVGDSRKGDNLWTASIVALNADTGKLVWYFQCSPHDTHDWDATQVPVLFDAEINGQPRKLLAQASRNGGFFVLDRTNGKNIVSARYSESANGFSGFAANGQPIPDAEKEPHIGGSLVSPANGGISNWPPPTYSPQTGLFYVNVSQSYAVYYRTELNPKAQAYGGVSEHYVGGPGDSLRAIDPKTGNIKWVHNYAGTVGTALRPEFLAGLMSTAGGLLFGGGTSSHLVAYEPAAGNVLWHSALHTPMTNGPISYMLDGRQYVVVGAGDSLYAFALNQ